MSEGDVLAIQDVLVRYATGIDQRDWTLFRTCFTADVDADYGPFGHWHGVDEITAYMQDAHKDFGYTLHRLSNFAIRVDGDTATARTYVDVLLFPKADGGQSRQGIGWYDDELVRTEDGWKIARRRHVSVHVA